MLFNQVLSPQPQQLYPKPNLSFSSSIGEISSSTFGDLFAAYLWKLMVWMILEGI